MNGPASIPTGAPWQTTVSLGDDAEATVLRDQNGSVAIQMCPAFARNVAARDLRDFGHLLLAAADEQEAIHGEPTTGTSA